MAKLVIDDKINELFDAIYKSDLYKDYKKIEKVLANDNEIKELIEDIKKLERKATYLEHNGNLEYKKIDEEIKEKTDILNNKSIYREYLNRLEEFEEELIISKNIIEKYIADKV